MEVIAINNPGINDGGLAGMTEADSGYVLKKEPKGFPNRVHLSVKGKSQTTGFWPEQPQKWPFCELLREGSGRGSGRGISEAWFRCVKSEMSV